MNTEPTVVKIAVKMEPKLPQLIKFDQSVHLSIIIETLCSEWGIMDVDKYALMFESDNYYVTEQNRTVIKDGTVLILTFSPQTLAQDIIQSLKSFSDGTMNKVQRKNFNLQNLSKVCIDKTFSDAFIEESGLTLLIDFIEKGKYQNTPLILVNALSSFISIMKHGTVSWSILETPFVIVISNFFSEQRIQETKIVQYSESILESIVLNCSDKYNLIKKTVGFPKLLIQQIEKDNFKQITLSLFNVLFLKAAPDATKTISNALFNKENLLILQNILNAGDVKPDMAHQLYILQTLCLNVLEIRMNTEIDPQDENVKYKIKELRQIQFELDATGGGDVDGKSLGPFVIENKLGFSDEEFPALDFRRCPPGMLAFDCIVYFAENHKDHYDQIILENSCRIDNRGCPVIQSSVEIVRILCKQLKIGVPPSKHKTKYFHLLFSHEYPFFELYCVCIRHMNGTWKKMGATAGDFEKIVNIVMTQVACAMNSNDSVNFKKFEQNLSTQTYNDPSNQWQMKNSAKIKQNSFFQIEETLEELVKSEIVQLIKAQRLNYMIEGSRFTKIEQEGSEKYWFIKLSKNHSFLQYNHCDDAGNPVKDEYKYTIRITNIKSLNIDRDDPQIARGQKPKLLFQLTLESMDKPFSFLALNERTYDYWMDGINALMGNQMTSNEAKNDYDRLLSMEIKLRTLEDN